MSISLSPMNAALSALAGLNDVTSQMTDAQNQISTGKAVNSYADNPAVFYTATTLTNQQNTLKQSATMLNSNLSSITGAQSSLTTVQDALTKINTALSGLADQTATQATRNALAQTIQNETAALNSAITDDANNALALGRGSLIAGGAGNGGLVVNLGNGQQMAIGGANLTIQANAAGNLGFSQADVASIVKLAAAGTVADNTATAVATATVGPIGSTSTVNGTFSTSIVYADASGNTKDANGNIYSATTTAPGVTLRSVTTFTPDGGGAAQVVGVDSPPTGTTGPSTGATATSTGTFTVTDVYADANGNVTNPATGRAYTAADAANNANLKIVGQGVASGLSNTSFKYTPVTVAAVAAAGQISTNTVGNVTTTVTNAYSDANGVTINPTTGAAYTAADAAASNSGIKLRQVTTTTTLGLATYIANLQAGVQAGLATANAFGRVLGGAADAINTVLNNNTTLQNSLSSQISNLVDADVAGEQVKLQALQVQQQLSVSALSSINQSRQALLSLFR